VTAQIADVLEWEGNEWLLAGVKGSGLFRPSQVGLVTEVMSTACYRGYVCRYVVESGRLLLDRLSVRTVDGRLPEIEGRSPKREGLLGALVYSGLGLAVGVTGSLLVVRDEVSAVLRGVTPSPVAFALVCEMVFDAGVLVRHQDLSSSAAASRAEAQALLRSADVEMSRDEYRKFSQLCWAVAPEFEHLPDLASGKP
jgi:hypothetical protein